MKKQALFLLTLGALVALLGLFWIWRTPQKEGSLDLSKQFEEKPLNHLGIIMDGNRRWAKQHGFKPWIGHEEGVGPIKTTVKFCLKYHIPYLTLYVFSLENFKRPEQEVSYLFDILAQKVASEEFETLYKEGVKLQFIGDRSRFPAKLISLINDLEEKTKNNSNLTLSLLFCYGGQQELVAGVQTLCEQARAGKLDPQTITYEQFIGALWSHTLPPLDLVIRTAGDQRLSNFLPLQAGYSELYFIPCYWPEVSEKELEEAALYYLNHERRFGK